MSQPSINARSYDSIAPRSVAFLGLGVMAGAGATMPDGRPTPTGLEVPRWISLKSSHVRARQGPGQAAGDRARGQCTENQAEHTERNAQCSRPRFRGAVLLTAAFGQGFLVPQQAGDRSIPGRPKYCKCNSSNAVVGCLAVPC